MHDYQEAGKKVRDEKRTIVHSHHSAERITARTPVTDFTGSLPADLWADAILG